MKSTKRPVLGVTNICNLERDFEAGLRTMVHEIMHVVVRTCILMESSQSWSAMMSACPPWSQDERRKLYRYFEVDSSCTYSL